MLSQDTADLICAVEENISAAGAPTNLHIKTEYDNIPSKDVVKIKRWFLKEGSAFHRRARKFLSQFDRDIVSQQKPLDKRMRVAIGSFSIAQSIQEYGDK